MRVAELQRIARYRPVWGVEIYIHQYVTLVQYVFLLCVSLYVWHVSIVAEVLPRGSICTSPRSTLQLIIGIALVYVSCMMLDRKV